MSLRRIDWKVNDTESVKLKFYYDNTRSSLSAGSTAQNPPRELITFLGIT